MYRAFCLCQNLNPGMVFVCHWICRIFKLLGHEYIRVFLCHPQCCFHAFFNTGSDIPGIMDKHQLRAVMLDKLPALLTDRIRHDNPGLIAAHGSD